MRPRRIASVAQALPAFRQILRRHAKGLPRKAFRVWSEQGLRGLLTRATNLFRYERPIDVFYSEWVRQFDTLTDDTRQAIRADIATWPAPPMISIVMPAYDTDLRWLAAAIRSAEKQLYPHWERCISDDASRREGLRDLLQDQARRDSRIRVHLRDRNANVSINSNSALALAGG